MENPEKTLFNPGENGETVFYMLGRDVGIKTYFVDKTTKKWSLEEIIELLNDGMQYRLLKKAKTVS